MDLNKRKKVSLPHFGKYTKLLAGSLENLGAEVILPPKITDRTIKLGSRHSGEMMCFPYKVTLGNFMEVLETEPDLDYLIMFDSGGSCRFRHYHTLQKQTLGELGHKAEMVPWNIRDVMAFHKKVTPHASKKDIIVEYFRLYRRIRELSDVPILSEDRPNIAVIGEVYTCIEPSVNFNIEQELERAGCNVVETLTLYSFLRDSLKKLFLRGSFKDKYQKEGEDYLNGPLGGHGAENVENTLRYIDRGVDGVVWLRPLTCMPESTVDMVVKRICRAKNIPVLVFDIDESNFALNIATRLETFIEQIKGMYEEKVLLHRL